MLVRWLLLLSGSLAAIASPTWQLPLEAPSPSTPTMNAAASPPLSAMAGPEALLFASFTSLLRQWPNTLFPNGHSIILGTVPPGTLLFHARKDLEPVPRTEWLAFDAEMSYGIMAGRGGKTYLNTYGATRALRVLVLDGQSAALGETGWLDSQAVLLYGNVSDTGGGWGMGGWAGKEYERARGLCELGAKWGFEGIVRMNAGFELVWCDFDTGLKLVSHLNVTDPFAGPSFGFPSPPDSPDRAVRLLESRSREGQDPPREPPDAPPGGPPPGRWPNGSFPGWPSWPYGRRRPGGPRGRFPSSPFAASATYEWQRSATWHYWGEARVVLDPSTWVTFYDPDVKSLAAIRQRDGINEHREKQRLLGISLSDAAAVREKVRLALKEKIARGWATPSTDVDWRAISDSVVDMYSDRLAELRYFLTSSNTSINATTTAVRVRRISYTLLMPYIDMTKYSNNSRAWLDPAVQRCQTAFTNVLPDQPLTHSEIMIKQSIEGVLQRICKTLGTVFGDTVLMGLPVSEAPPPDPAALERRARTSLRAWTKQIGGLMDWLGWAGWLRCEKVCALDEVCVIPMWPLGGFRGPGRGGDEKVVPKCVGQDDPWG